MAAVGDDFARGKITGKMTKELGKDTREIQPVIAENFRILNPPLSEWLSRGTRDSGLSLWLGKAITSWSNQLKTHYRSGV